MKFAAIVLVSFMLLSSGCKADYDIEEIVSQEYMGETQHQETETLEQDSSAIIGTDRHVHEAGQKNHGTAWFFNQPWATSFIWGKMVRDSVILLILAAAILFVSGYRKKHR